LREKNPCISGLACGSCGAKEESRPAGWLRQVMETLLRSVGRPCSAELQVSTSGSRV
jgi:hypothetical protein